MVFLSGVLGASLFALASILGGLQIEGYSTVSQYISESFATGLPNTGYLRLMYVIGGFLLFIFGVMAPTVLPKSKILKIGFLLFAIFYGLGTITVALFPCDFGCPSDIENLSLSQFIHNIVGFFTYLITPLGMIATGVASRKWHYLNGLSKVSLICGVIALTFVFFLFTDSTGPYIGLFQRIIECNILFWVVYTAFFSRVSKYQVR